jgi:prepilin-type N-terminal cleavage/methylation domain-containing protein
MIKRKIFFSKFIESLGFTFIELLVTVSIVSLLAVVVAANYRSFTAKRSVRNVAEELKSYLVLAQKSAQAGKKTCDNAYLGTRIEIIPPLDCAIYSRCEGDELDEFMDCQFSDNNVVFENITGSNPLDFDTLGVPSDIFSVDVSRSDSSEIWSVVVDTSGIVSVNKI